MTCGEYVEYFSRKSEGKKDKDPPLGRVSLSIQCSRTNVGVVLVAVLPGHLVVEGRVLVRLLPLHDITRVLVCLAARLGNIKQCLRKLFI